MRCIGLVTTVALVCGHPAMASMTPQQRNDLLQQAISAQKDHQPDRVVELTDKVIKDFDEGFTPKPKTLYFCGRDQTEMIILSALVPAEKFGTVVLDDSQCFALFLKGFALVDLNRHDEAGPLFQRASEMSPTNMQYMDEYAEWFKTSHKWREAYDRFEQANNMTDLIDAQHGQIHLARALRGMGFCLIELGRLDDAEAKFNESLKIVPNNPAALNELKYIQQLRANLAKQKPN